MTVAFFACLERKLLLLLDPLPLEEAPLADPLLADADFWLISSCVVARVFWGVDFLDFNHYVTSLPGLGSQNFDQDGCQEALPSVANTS